MSRWYIDPERAARLAEESRYWTSLRDRLPPDRVWRWFPSADDCRVRLQQVRWPAGPICVACSSKNVIQLRTRPVLKCRDCKKQFTVLVGTPLQHSRLDLTHWFAATEMVIRHRARHVDEDIPGTELAERLAVYFDAAYRLRRVILDDVQPGGRGLLRAAVCILPEETSDAS